MRSATMRPAVSAGDRDRPELCEGAQQPWRGADAHEPARRGRAEFRVALPAEPRSVESLVNLALVERSAGRAADARGLLRRAVAIDPRNAGSHYNLAVVADETGDATTAIEHYRAFLRFGAVANDSLAAQVRARLTALGG